MLSCLDDPLHIYASSASSLQLDSLTGESGASLQSVTCYLDDHVGILGQLHTVLIYNVVSPAVQARFQLQYTALDSQI